MIRPQARLHPISGHFHHLVCTGEQRVPLHRGIDMRRHQHSSWMRLARKPLSEASSMAPAMHMEVPGNRLRVEHLASDNMSWQQISGKPLTIRAVASAPEGSAVAMRGAHASYLRPCKACPAAGCGSANRCSASVCLAPTLSLLVQVNCHYARATSASWSLFGANVHGQ